MSGIRVEGNTSGNVAEVDANNNLFVNLPQTVGEAGFANISGQTGDGNLTGGVITNQYGRISRSHRLAVGTDTLEFDYNFSATAQDTGVWKFATTTMTPRRVPLGYETFAATAAVGTVGSPGGCYMAFNSPIAVNPGEFVAICAKNLGTVTTAGVIAFLVTFDAYWY